MLNLVHTRSAILNPDKVQIVCRCCTPTRNRWPKYRRSEFVSDNHTLSISVGGVRRQSSLSIKNIDNLARAWEILGAVIIKDPPFLRTRLNSLNRLILSGICSMPSWQIR